MNISNLNIPKDLIDLLAIKGYNELYPSQVEAIKAPILEGENILMTTPTASGKTLVALIATGKVVIEKAGKVVYLTPLGSLAKKIKEQLKS